ncbi:MAG: methylenetetrahydrofolate reductase C-terminal domain-containing protein [Candidatus Omnitrophica bacterium]|jgi:ferredoxin|nr:methylenetetrahydrofolate reductase C-terminal domain-containing protein [Candidatus Omnitrophota bacterium]
MIVSRQKNIDQIIKSLEDYKKIFLIGCGECATICKSGGEEEVKIMRDLLTAAGKVITGSSLPSAPCLAAKIKIELAKNAAALKDADAVLVLACGLGVQSIKENDRLGKDILPACDTLFGAVMNGRGDFYGKCLACGECVLGETSAICPVTLCPKGMLNGPCGGMDKGKCDVDKKSDCAWVLIYRELEKKEKLNNLRKIQPAKNHQKALRPAKMIAHK